jgi:hypothetical protein
MVGNYFLYFYLWYFRIFNERKYNLYPESSKSEFVKETQNSTY